MEWLVAGVVIGLCVHTLREEFRSGGSLNLRNLVGEVPAGHPEFAHLDPADLPAPPIVIVSPRGVEIPAGLLTPQEIIDALADIDRIDEIEAAA